MDKYALAGYCEFGYRLFYKETFTTPYFELVKLPIPYVTEYAF